MNIEWVPAHSLKAPDWNITYALRPDRKVMETVLVEHGWLFPVIARTDGTILYNLDYWDLACEQPKLIGKNVPVIWVECDLADAIILHIRLHRGQPEIIPRDMSKALKKLRRTHKYTEEEIKTILSMTWEELDLLFDGTLIKARKIKEHNYSRAWVPVDAVEGQPITVERPPNKDK